MKYIPFRDFSTAEEPNGLKTEEIIRIIANQVPNGAVAQEIMDRVTVLKALKRDTEARAPGMQLEDADYARFKKWTEEFKFVIATIPLGQILDDIRNAQEPPAVIKAVTSEKAA
jgi:hypothetical protein